MAFRVLVCLFSAVLAAEEPLHADDVCQGEECSLGMLQVSSQQRIEEETPDNSPFKEYFQNLNERIADASEVDTFNEYSAVPTGPPPDGRIVLVTGDYKTTKPTACYHTYKRYAENCWYGNGPIAGTSALVPYLIKNPVYLNDTNCAKIMKDAGVRLFVGVEDPSCPKGSAKIYTNVPKAQIMMNVLTATKWDVFREQTGGPAGWPTSPMAKECGKWPFPAYPKGTDEHPLTTAELEGATVSLLPSMTPPDGWVNKWYQEQCDLWGLAPVVCGGSYADNAESGKPAREKYGAVALPAGFSCVMNPKMRELFGDVKDMVTFYRPDLDEPSFRYKGLCCNGDCTCKEMTVSPICTEKQ